jgi:hypothetical protein
LLHDLRAAADRLAGANPTQVYFSEFAREPALFLSIKTWNVQLFPILEC